MTFEVNHDDILKIHHVIPIISKQELNLNELKEN
jgi:hypothetical protein